MPLSERSDRPLKIIPKGNKPFLAVNSQSGVVAEMKLKHSAELETQKEKLTRTRKQRNIVALVLGASVFALIILIVIVGIASNRSATRQIRINNLEKKVLNLTQSLQESQTIYGTLLQTYQQLLNNSNTNST